MDNLVVSKTFVEGDKDPQSCIDKCPDGQFNNNGICNPCNNVLCKKCSNNKTCDECVDKALMENGICVGKCSKYYVERNGKCNKCTNNNCLYCDNLTLAQCKTCESPYKQKEERLCQRLWSRIPTIL